MTETNKELSDSKGAHEIKIAGALQRSNNTYKGKPYKGPTYIVNGTNKPVKKCTVKVRIFSLNIPEDLLAYEQVCQAIGDNTAQQSTEERIYDKEIGSWKIFLRWIEYFYQAPKEDLTQAPRDSIKIGGV